MFFVHELVPMSLERWILPLPPHPQVSTRLQALYAAVCSATKEDNIAAASDDFRAPDLRTVCIVQ